MRLTGRVAIVQEDRIRLIDGEGRGYLLTVGPRVASLEELEWMRDTGVAVELRYDGTPDRGAVVTSLRVPSAGGSNDR